METETPVQEARFMLSNARRLAADYVRRTVLPGDTVVDATMGNGHDTLLLCGLVGENGRVYAFDVQPEALASTGARLEQAHMRGRATLLQAGHETMERHVEGQPSAVMFNLGWLQMCIRDRMYTVRSPKAAARIRLTWPSARK